MPNSRLHLRAIALIGGLALAAAPCLPVAAAAAAAPATLAPSTLDGQHDQHDQQGQHDPNAGHEVSCVTVDAGWRYAFATNSCPYPVTVRVTYTDEDSAACRVIEPGLVATFPGYGPGEYRMPRITVC